MFIKQLQIKNFKCFKDITIGNLAVPNGSKGSGLNILIGENGNGKTTFLESLNYLTLNSYSVENKLSINDFNDYKNPLEVIAEIDDFKCNSSIGIYNQNKWYFKSNGISFFAKSRERKEANKLLSSSFETHTWFNITSQYYDKNDTPKKDVDSRDKTFNNSLIKDDGINIFYFDKNRNRQITTGNYKTTFEKILDDLNWRFRKKLTPENELTLIENIVGEYFDNVEKIIDASAGSKTANDLKDFFDNQIYENLKIDLLSLLNPFNNAFFTLREENSLKQILIKDLGSGIEIILTLLLLKNIANASKGKIIYLIDEPELHLHPKAQEKLLELLLEEAKDKQIFISTHSPYMFKGAIGNGANLIILKRDTDKNIEVKNARDGSWGIFGEYSPTWGEINWFAYDLATVEFHNELYGFLQAQAINNDDKFEKEKEFDQWITDNLNVQKDKTWKRFKENECKQPYDVTLQTFIRNSIHHPENKCNAQYTSVDLRQSIIQMLNYINGIG